LVIQRIHGGLKYRTTVIVASSFAMSAASLAESLANTLAEQFITGVREFLE
jgi:hypothetical protein